MIDRRFLEALGLAIVASGFGLLALGVLYVSG
jgi:hypothetical protein